MGEALVYSLKVALAVAVGVAFFAAVLILLSAITSFATTARLVNVIQLIGIYMPFKPNAIFALFVGYFAAIIGFLTARKTYQLLHSMHKESS